MKIEEVIANGAKYARNTFSGELVRIVEGKVVQIVAPTLGNQMDMLQMLFNESDADSSWQQISIGEAFSRTLAVVIVERESSLTPLGDSQA